MSHHFAKQEAHSQLKTRCVWIKYLKKVLKVSTTFSYYSDTQMLLMSIVYRAHRHHSCDTTFSLSGQMKKDPTRL